MNVARITMVCHDWGGSLGLRVLSQMPERFGRLVASNTVISPGGAMSNKFLNWRRYSQRATFLDVPFLMRKTLA
ncbi:MAG: hypothetical protein ABIZ80_05515 [Bryobacteraceae bacterium]